MLAAKRWVQQFNNFLSLNLKVELAEKDRLISPILFGLTILILFSFAFGEVDQDFKIRSFVAQMYLMLFLALQAALQRSFEPEQRDRGFDLIVTYQPSITAWFCAKLLSTLMLAFLIILPAMMVSVVIQQQQLQFSEFAILLGIISLASIGLSALGILLAAMTAKAHARQILYPLLYFPLTTPVLLASVESSRLFLEAPANSYSAWLWLLVTFDVVYVTLALLLFEEIVHSD